MTKEEVAGEKAVASEISQLFIFDFIGLSCGLANTLH